jgi:hypothetical protein
MTAPPPFVVFALPRSRTAWLARALSVGPWMCGHEQLRHCRSLDDVSAWLGQPYAGTVETVGAPYWRLLAQMAPAARVVVLRRPVPEVVASLMKFGLFDEPALTVAMTRMDAKLRQIAARWPGALSVSFADLDDEASVSRLVEHCTGNPLDHDWWETISPVNVQVNLPHMLRQFLAHKPQMEKLSVTARHRIAASLACDRGEMDGVTFQTESFDAFYRDAELLFREHLVQTGQHPEDHATKNLPLLQALDDVGALHVFTGRSNGRMFSYLVSVIAPSLDATDEMLAEQTLFFADPGFPGLGMKTQRAAVADLKARGVDRVLMRAGHRGSGPRLGAIFRRLGAMPFGQLYSLET